MIPGPVVEAAARALAAEDGFADQWETYSEDAQRALRAAFAVLPECEEAQPPKGYEWQPKPNWRGWKDCLAALAEMAEQ